MKKLTLILFLTIGAILLGACGAEENDEDNKGAENGDTKNDTVITIGNAPYDYETPPIEITKLIAEEHGYEVEVMEGDVAFMFLSLTQNDVDIWPGIWPEIHRTYLDKFEGEFEMGATIYDEAPTGWAVPTYVEADTIGELVGNEDMVNGKLVGFEPGSGMMLTTEEVVEAHGLDLEVVSGTMASMMAEVDYAISQEEPILFLGWRPHTMFRNYDLKILEDEKGIWGVDSQAWGVSNDFQDKAPEIYNFVTNFEMSIEEVEKYLYNNQDEGKDVEELAQQWIDDNRSDIDAWLEAE
ncbi:glycine betaine ABC transporter substrate-binding protein [Aquibacillus saliphilus]|uniref:glycine betaine ABC transporter substrate-binding protein n=1 Tax=Aquibacillus saliphilus TaxID=1909422 RepID=UPI001CF069D2|nr:glycine betaine ABC transporter substrate-binding protein [Aquibacillus saliphilus]